METKFEGNKIFDSKPLAKPRVRGIEYYYSVVCIRELNSILSHRKYLIHWCINYFGVYVAQTVISFSIIICLSQ